ncbi:MAG: hypothetical protein EI684_04215 [Candidatus Viridilinea halotolerans]|uniref:Uncharacterized protein n=1 Tax=Candidatus Viridilinea halotolerans TaxID=2491704 RepID=A0A426U6R2_9CHLR|nr:MAG: hypothetical protein EI684_04215 [Candidatus Viridilinea halotolerans]
MQRHPALWMLLFWLVFLAFGGLYGGIAMLLDPSGAAMGVDILLPRLPVPNFILPGLFLLFVMGLAPLAMSFGLFVRPNWPWAAALARWSGHYWAWTGTLILGLLLLIWLAVQAAMIGFSAGIQYVMVVNGLALLGIALWPAVEQMYRLGKGTGARN